MTGELPARVQDWPADWLDRFEERAALMEFEVPLSREEAERRAEAHLRELHARAHPPATVQRGLPLGPAPEQGGEAELEPRREAETVVGPRAREALG